MAVHYSEETQTILGDFLATLQADPRVDPDLLRALSWMVKAGKLDSTVQIHQVLRQLGERAGGRQDR
jgi:uncharacterized protein YneF (UPF0154 family)